MRKTAMRYKAPQSFEDCQAQLAIMLRRSKTKVIAPTLTFGLLKSHLATGQTVFSEREVQHAYAGGVRQMQVFMKHSLHIGAKWEDAYSRRTLPKYGVLRVTENGYELLPPFTTHSKSLLAWIPHQILSYIEAKLGIVPQLADLQFRTEIASRPANFMQLLETNIEKNPANFEFICFAVLRVHLEKFACRIYRDTRAAAHDKGVDISTNFGVVYQIKKLRVVDRKTCEAIKSELQHNFDSQRLDDGKVILVIDDIRKEWKEFLINMKVQSITKADLLKLARQFEDPEDREKVLRIIHEEFRREYASIFE